MSYTLDGDELYYEALTVAVDDEELLRQIGSDLVLAMSLIPISGTVIPGNLRELRYRATEIINLVNSYELIKGIL